MRYTHASSPEEISLSPLFPLTTEAFEEPIAAFGDFSARDVEMITYLNSNQVPIRRPLEHLLNLQESPMMADVEGLFREEFGMTQSGPSARCYRVGVVLAAATLRRQASRLPMAIDEWPISTPGRTYLRVPEWLDAERANVYSRLGVERQSERTNYYVDTMSTERYVEDGAALSEAIVNMGMRWEGAQLSILTDSPRQWNHELFGDVCHGFADTIRLRAMLEYEARVAPSSQIVFDPELHFPISDATTEGVTLHAKALDIARELHNRPKDVNVLSARYPLEGVATQESVVGARDEPWDVVLLEPELRWGDTVLPLYHKAASLHRAVGGFTLSKVNGEVIPVGFRKSEEVFIPEQEDVLVTAGLGYGQLGEPFIADEPSIIAALSERGSAPFLSTSNRLYSDPKLHEPDRGFMQVLQRALQATADERQRTILEALPFY